VNEVRPSMNNGQPKGRYLVRGMLAGAAGGFAAAFVISQFHARPSDLAKKEPASRRVTPEPEEGKPGAATEKTVDASARILSENHLKKDGRTFFSSPIARYAFGSAMGALYGAAVERSPMGGTGVGTFFGSALFVGANGIAVPALQHSQSTEEQSAKPVLVRWLLRMAYGTTMELVRSSMRHIV
jgi:putative membrane protein